VRWLNRCRRPASQHHPAGGAQQRTSQRPHQVRGGESRAIRPDQQQDVDSEGGEGGVTAEHAGAEERPGQRMPRHRSVIATISTPRTNDPVTLIVSVVHGNSGAEVGTSGPVDSGSGIR